MASTHRDGDLPQDVLGERQAFLDHHLVELVQGRVHQLHADPHVALHGWKGHGRLSGHAGLLGTTAAGNKGGGGHLSEQGAVEGDRVETVHRPHGDVQVHQQPLLLLSVDRGPDPLDDHKHSGVRMIAL